MAEPRDSHARIRQAAFGDGPLTPSQRFAGVAALMHVLADALADSDDATVLGVAQRIAVLRAHRMAERTAQAQFERAIASLEVAGHG